MKMKKKSKKKGKMSSKERAKIRLRISVRIRAGPVNAVSYGSDGLQSRCTLSVHTVHWHCHRHVSLKHRHPTHRGTSTCDEEIIFVKRCFLL